MESTKRQLADAKAMQSRAVEIAVAAAKADAEALRAVAVAEAVAKMKADAQNLLAKRRQAAAVTDAAALAPQPVVAPVHVRAFSFSYQQPRL